MSGKRIKEVANAIKIFLKGRDVKVDKIVVFGSYAKDNYSVNSDLDIAIVSSDFDGKDIFQKADMIKGLSWHLVERFLFPFDIVTVSRREYQESSSLIIDFIKEGKVLV